MTINIIGAETGPITLNQIYETWDTIKRRYRDALVLLRTGNNYYSFEEDADIIATIMQHPSLQQWKERSLLILPYHATDVLLPKVVKAGYRAALCEPVPFRLFK